MPFQKNDELEDSIATIQIASVIILVAFVIFAILVVRKAYKKLIDFLNNKYKSQKYKVKEPVVAPPTQINVNDKATTAQVKQMMTYNQVYPFRDWSTANSSDGRGSVCTLKQ